MGEIRYSIRDDDDDCIEIFLILISSFLIFPTHFVIVLPKGISHLSKLEIFDIVNM